jgi:hypothetical protein
MAQLLPSMGDQEVVERLVEVPKKLKISPEVEVSAKLLDLSAAVKAKRISRTMAEAAYANGKLNRNKVGEMIAVNPFYRGERRDGDYYTWLNDDYYEGNMPPLVRTANSFREFPQNDDPRFNPTSWRMWKAYYRSPKFQAEYAKIKPYILTYITTCGEKHAAHIAILDAYHSDLRDRGHCKTRDLLLGRRENQTVLHHKLAKEVEKLSTPPTLDDYYADEIEDPPVSPGLQYHSPASDLMISPRQPGFENYGAGMEDGPFSPGVQYHSPAGELMVSQHIPESEDYGTNQERSNINNLAAAMCVTSLIGPPPASDPFATSPPNLPFPDDYQPDNDTTGCIFDQPRAPTPYYGPPTTPMLQTSPASVEDAQSPEGTSENSQSPSTDSDSQSSSSDSDSGGSSDSPFEPGAPFEPALALGLEPGEVDEFNSTVRVEYVMRENQRERYRPGSPRSGASFRLESLAGAVQEPEPSSAGGIPVQLEQSTPDDEDFFRFPITPTAGNLSLLELASTVESTVDQNSEPSGGGLRDWSDRQDISQRPGTPYPFGVVASSPEEDQESSGSSTSAKRDRAEDDDDDDDDEEPRSAKRRKAKDSDEDFEPDDSGDSSDPNPPKRRLIARRGGRSNRRGSMR